MQPFFSVFFFWYKSIAKLKKKGINITEKQKNKKLTERFFFSTVKPVG